MKLQIVIRNTSGKGRNVSWIKGGLWLDNNEEKTVDVSRIIMGTENATDLGMMRQRDYEIKEGWLAVSLITDLPPAHVTGPAAKAVPAVEAAVEPEPAVVAEPIAVEPVSDLKETLVEQIVQDILLQPEQVVSQNPVLPKSTGVPLPVLSDSPQVSILDTGISRKSLDSFLPEAKTLFAEDVNKPMDLPNMPGVERISTGDVDNTGRLPRLPTLIPAPNFGDTMAVPVGKSALENVVRPGVTHVIEEKQEIFERTPAPGMEKRTAPSAPKPPPQKINKLFRKDQEPAGSFSAVPSRPARTVVAPTQGDFKRE
jgi:hypothetical protein